MKGKDVRRGPEEAGAPTLKADFAPPTGSQAAAIGDALRLVAAWAVRAARRDAEGAEQPDVTAGNQLDFPRNQSDSCEAAQGHDER